jgi:hypothetical protein
MVVWFSCGVASAVAVQRCLTQYTGEYDIAVARCVVANEHPDNGRFTKDCERWFGVPIINLISPKYVSCWDVWERERYLVGPQGAPCTKHMKRNVRLIFESTWCPDVQVFGYTSEEAGRAERFRTLNPQVVLLTPLINDQLSKADCFTIIGKAGIPIPAMYRLGFNNNNCIGCVKGGKGYWNRVRRVFPKTFQRMAQLERTIGASVLHDKGGRVFLDQLPTSAGRHKEPDIDCSLFCYGEGDGR